MHKAEQLKQVTFVRVVLIVNFLHPFFVRYLRFPDISRLYTNIAIIVFWFLATVVKHPAGARRASKDSAQVVFLLVVVLLSAAINRSNWFVTAKVLVEEHLPYMLLFMLIVSTSLEQKEGEQLFNLCYVLILLQVPVALAQFFLGGYTNLDSNSGTLSRADLGGTNLTVVLSAFLTGRYVLRMILDRVRARYLALAVCTVVPMVVGGARYGFVVIPIAIVASVLTPFYLRWSVGAKRVLTLVLVALVLLATLLVAVVYVIPRSPLLSQFLDLDVLLNPERRLEYDSSGAGGTGRIAGYARLYNLMSDRPSTLLFGLGSEAMGESKLGGVSSNLLRSRVYQRVSSALSYFASLGIMGVAFMVFVFIYGALFVRKYVRLEYSPIMRLNAAAFIPISVICIASTFYTDVWGSPIGLVYWVMYGVLVRRYYDLGGSAVEASVASGVDAATNPRTLSTT
jgi:hypothetical protein